MACWIITIENAEWNAYVSVCNVASPNCDSYSPVVEVVELCCKWKDVDGAIIMGSAAFVRVFQGSKILIILSIITGTTPLSARINNL